MKRLNPCGKRGDFVQAKWGVEWFCGRIQENRMASPSLSDHGGKAQYGEVLVRFQGRGRDSERWFPLNDPTRLRVQCVLRELIPPSRGRASGFPKPDDFVSVYSADASNASSLRARGHPLPGVVLASHPGRDACKIKVFTLRVDQDDEGPEGGVVLGMYWNAHLKVIDQNEFTYLRSAVRLLREQLVAAVTLANRLMGEDAKKSSFSRNSKPYKDQTSQQYDKCSAKNSIVAAADVLRRRSGMDLNEGKKEEKEKEAKSEGKVGADHNTWEHRR